MSRVSRKRISIYDTYIDCISFGSGKENLLIIPGLGESFIPFKYAKIPLSFIYRKYAKKYKVYVFNRRNKLPDNFTVQEMAEDYVKCMNILGIEKTNILGISLGGMIAQEIAISKNNLVNKLILVVTIPKSNQIIKDNIDKWLDLAVNKKYLNIMIDTCNKSYRGLSLVKNRLKYSIMSIFKPNRFDRFIIEAKACITHNSIDRLKSIKNETLIIGAEKDKILDVEGSLKLHELLTNSKLYIYKKYSHGVYEEAKDFKKRVIEFLSK